MTANQKHDWLLQVKFSYSFILISLQESSGSSSCSDESSSEEEIPVKSLPRRKPQLTATNTYPAPNKEVAHVQNDDSQSKKPSPQKFPPTVPKDESMSDMKEIDIKRDSVASSRFKKSFELPRVSDESHRMESVADNKRLTNIPETHHIHPDAAGKAPSTVRKLPDAACKVPHRSMESKCKSKSQPALGLYCITLPVLL